MSKKDLMLGMAIGAAVAFLADPDSGRRRRTSTRDQFMRHGRRTRKAVGASVRHVANRGMGMLAANRGKWTADTADDRQLAERVRAKLGHVASNAKSIDVTAADGIVTLRGPVPTDEMPDVLAAVWSVQGVLAVNSDLEALEPRNQPLPQPQIDGWHVGVTPRDVSRRWTRPTQALMTAAGLTATGLAVAAYASRRTESEPREH